MMVIVVLALEVCGVRFVFLVLARRILLAHVPAGPVAIAVGCDSKELCVVCSNQYLCSSTTCSSRKIAVTMAVVADMWLCGWWMGGSNKFL